MNSALDHTREFPFSAEHFRVITDRMYGFSGIKLPEAKREMVYARLARRLRSLGLASFDDYVRYLEAEPSEWEHCTNALTTNVTSFFREEHHFRVLAEHAQGRAGKAGAYRVWSAGCSTGEEPYSIAMTLADTLRAAQLPHRGERPRHPGARRGAPRGLSAGSGPQASRVAAETFLPARHRAQ